MTTSVPKCVTQELFAKAVQKHWSNKNIRILDYTCTLAVPSSDSYNSNLFRSSITYSTGKNGNKSTMSVVVKCCPEANGQPFEVTNDMKFFDKEIQMYTEILPEVHNILGSLGTLSAKHIHVQETPIRIIIMEDLSEQGFKMLDRREGLDLEHCKLVIKKLAQLHAASVLVHEKKPQAFSLFYQALYPGNSTINLWIKTAITEIVKVCARRPGMEKYIEKLKQYEGKILEKCADVTKLSHFFNVLNHGDCWTNNIMFQYDSKGKLRDLRFIDFQIGVYSSPVIDLHYFWATSPNLEVRRLHLDTILDYYYDQLVATLTKLKYNIDKIPSKENYLNEWISKAHYGFAATVTVAALTKASSRHDASLLTLLDPEQNYEGSFRHELFNNSLYWKHLEYILYFFDRLRLFDC